MGSFGYKPWESDCTTTQLIDITECKDPTKIKNIFLKKLRISKTGYNDQCSIRYMAYYIGMMNKAGLIKDKDLINSAKAAYEWLLHQNDWIRDWKNPQLIRKHLEKEYKLFL